MKHHLAFVALLFVGCLMAGTPAHADTMSLSALLGGGSFSFNGLTFSGFTASGITGSQADHMTVNIDTTVANRVDLQFVPDAANTPWIVSGEGQGAFQSRIDYTVSAAHPADGRISRSDLGVLFGPVGFIPVPGSDVFQGLAGVDVFLNGPYDPSHFRPADLSVLCWDLPAQSCLDETGFSNPAAFSPYLSSVSVDDVISGFFSIDGFGPGIAQVKSFDQSFDVTDVPEPATCTLLGTGIAGFILRRRRQRSATPAARTR